MIPRGPLDFNTARVRPFGGEHKFSPKSENYLIIEFKGKNPYERHIFPFLYRSHQLEHIRSRRQIMQP